MGSWLQPARAAALLSLALVVSTSMPGTARAADSPVQVADAVPLALHDGPEARATLVLTSTAGPLTNLKIAVRELKAPDGQSLPVSLVKAEPEQPTLLAEGTRVTILPDSSAMTRPGDYLLVLSVSAGQIGVGPQARPLHTRVVTVTLRREQAALGAEPLRLRLERPSPFQAAQRYVPYTVENRGKVAVHGLGIDPLRVLLDTAQPDVGPGSVTVVMPPPPPGQALVRERSGQKLELPATGRLDFSLLFSEFSAVGRYKTGLVLRAPGLPEPLTVPVIVEVADRWPFALLALLAGGLLSLLLHLLVGRGRLRAENRYRLAHLGSEVEDLSVSGPTSATTRARLSEKLRRAGQREIDDNPALCQRLLDEVDAELDAYLKEQRELQATVRERLEQAQSLAQAILAKKALLTTDQAAKLREARLQLLDVTALVSAGQFEAAERTLKTALDAMQGIGQALRTEGPSASPSTTGVPSVAALLSALHEARLPRIRAVDAPGAHHVGAALRFRVEDERPDRKDDDLYQWSFDDGPTSAEGGEVSHSFPRPGEHEVRLTIKRSDGTEAATASLRLTLYLDRPIQELDLAPDPELRVQLVLSLLSLSLAAVIGLYVLCFSQVLVPFLGPVFGTGGHYLLALGGGLAIDFFLRGFAGLLRKLGTA